VKPPTSTALPQPLIVRDRKRCLGVEQHEVANPVLFRSTIGACRDPVVDAPSAA
jgi:hypothetical protein